MLYMVDLSLDAWIAEGLKALCRYLEAHAIMDSL
jgi:hypothetical protein